MMDAVFISDLHLNPDEPEITARFDQFIEWASHESIKSLYILGDFFHVWPGDEVIDPWCKEIAKKIQKLCGQGILVYYMHGNRDFLLGKRFTELAGWTVLNEPALIELGGEKCLLVHGDRYCTKDSWHQVFRKITRNQWFKKIFLALPYGFRRKLVTQVRQHSQSNRRKSMEIMDVVPEAVIQHMQILEVKTLIHGHTHQPGRTTYDLMSQAYQRFVLSDWDDNPQVLCYDNSKGLYFVHMGIDDKRG